MGLCTGTYNRESQVLQSQVVLGGRELTADVPTRASTLEKEVTPPREPASQKPRGKFSVDSTPGEKDEVISIMTRNSYNKCNLSP